jgi:hypothetical protein
VQTGCSAQQAQVVIVNRCDHAADLSGLALTGCAGACPFTVSGPILPATLAAGQSALASLGYVPSQAADTASLEVTETGQVPLAVALTGHGVQSAAEMDTLSPGPNKVDVLLVVDDSGSMASKQAALGQHFADFVGAAGGVDFQIAVTSTSTQVDSPANCTVTGFGSVAGCGHLAGPILTRQTPGLAQVFAAQVALGVQGDSTEQGFGGAFEALAATAIYGGPAATFLRPDARLAVVVMSDASDQSNQPAAYYLRYFDEVKASTGVQVVTLSAISSTGASPPAAQAATCTYDGTNAVPNPYAVAAAETGGAFEEICSADWAGTMSRIGRAVFAPTTITSLALHRDAAAGGVVSVAVNGAPLAGGIQGGATGWWLDAEINAIHFNQPVALTSTVAVAYARSCHPVPVDRFPDGGPGAP